MKKILIIGGTGFFGYHLCKNFLKLRFKVFSLSKFKPTRIRKLTSVKYLFGDISKIKSISFLKKKNFDYVINCGGYVDHTNKDKNKKNHLEGCKNLYSIFKKNKIKTFIQIGSSSEYGNVRSPQRETSRAIPRDIYGKAKLNASNFLISKKNKKDFPFVILRFYQIYGPYQDNNRFMTFVIKSCLKNKIFPCSEGKQFRDFLYIDDAVIAVNKSLGNKNAYGKIINIGYGKPFQIRKVINLIIDKIKKGKPQFGKIPLRAQEAMKLYPDLLRSKKYLKWSPKISFKKGLVKTIKFYKRYSLVY